MSDSSDFPSNAERYASRASQFPAFSGFNLAAARNDLAELLEAIRTNGFFDEYTKHDIKHVDAMLKQLDWIIPSDTQKIMTAADWLLIVLAAYFHDLGMLITKAEYEDREHSTAYVRFRHEMLNATDSAGRDFAARLEILKESDLEKFLYQEFVRQNHAFRIRAWIENQGSAEEGALGPAAEEVRRILSPLEPVFQQDLAIICESHHLDDLNDTNKYAIDRPYGSDSQESANVQYIAILLRTIDILHITKDRTPSIAFKLINPQDPVSQREWAKQSAVRQVRSKVALDSENNLDKTLPRDTIEVHARYDSADDYFGLTSYLEYAENQLRLSHEWIARSNRRLNTRHFFPWQHIDPSSIEAIGFINRPFEFTLDQGKILELLTGHTLYNDSSVVLRELVQNSLDAVRLAFGTRTSNDGRIIISWNSNARVLEITDNGIGMTQEVIERNFLRVGASYYQEPQFLKEHPDFFPISRFGIGVLSTFMVADQVEVITSHADEPKARKLELRTVRGKYLISLLDKATSPEVEKLEPSGTTVRLTLRPSARIPDVIELARRWIVVPGCKVVVSVDGGAAVDIGHSSVKDALETSLKNIGIDVESTAPDGESVVRVIQRSSQGVSLAFAVRWSSYFKEWQFFSPSLNDINGTEDAESDIGICVEGIRVKRGCPGYRRRLTAYSARSNPYAIANIVGRGAPRTNVARSDFESTDEYSNALATMYDLYCSHISEEVMQIGSERGQSITWAASEAQFLASAVADLEGAVWRDGLLSALSKIPMLLVEEGGVRSQVSAGSLDDRGSFWTIHGAFSEHIEYLLREIPSSLSFTKLLESSGATGLDLPNGTLLCSRLGNKVVDSLLYPQWSIAEIRGNEERRRCEARWVKSDTGPRWSTPGRASSHLATWQRATERALESLRFERATDPFGFEAVRSDRTRFTSIPLHGVTVEGFSHGESAVVVGSRTYLLPGTHWLEAIGFENSNESELEQVLSDDLRLTALSFMLGFNDLSIDSYERQLFPALADTKIADLVDMTRYAALLRTYGWSVFDTRRWQRG